MQLIRQNDISISDIISLLKQGKTIVYPTETCYGLGCDATNADGVNKVFEIKKRQQHKPVLVVASDAAMIMKYVKWDKIIQQVVERYWPGPVTVVVQANGEVKLPNGVIGKDGTLAFRITDHPLASELSRQLGCPLVSTSANISRLESPYDISSVLNMFENSDVQPDIVIDAGELPHQSPSTIIKINNGEVEVLRQGEVVVEL